MNATLLPPAPTGLERAADLVSDARYPVPADLVSSVWSPDRCPANLLGYLAWSLSIDLWDESWPEEKKREVCRRAFDLHRIKCTPTGIKAHVALVDSEVVQIRRPRRSYWVGAMTEDQRAAWLATLPQIRIYPFDKRELAPNRMFWRSAADGWLAGSPNKSRFWGLNFWRKSVGFAQFGRTAFYFDPESAEVGEDGALQQGVPIAFAASDTNLVTQIYMRTGTRGRMFLGRSFWGARSSYWRADDAELNTMTVSPLDATHSFAVPAGSRPVSVRPTRVSVRIVAPQGRAFWSRKHWGLRSPGGGAMRSSMGPTMIYDRYSLADPRRLGQTRRARAYWGHFKLGFAPFTAEMKIRVPMRWDRRSAGRWYGVGHWRQASMKPLANAIQAVRVSKAARDRILVDTAIVAAPTFSSSLKFGEFTFGKLIRSAA